MLLFVSQPMRGRTDDEIISERKQLIQYAKNKLCEVNLYTLDTFFKDAQHEDKPLKYLGEAIKMMSDADAVVFAKGWEHSRGCVVEHECAVRYGKKIIYV